MPFIAAEEHSPIIPPIGEIILGLVAFAILCLIFMKYVFPRFEQVYQERRDAIEGGIKRAEEAQAEAQKALEKYNAQLENARTEAAKIRDDARGEGQRIVDEMRAVAQAESARIIARGEEQLGAQRQQVVAELRQQVGRLSVQLASRIVGEALEDDARSRATVDRFLDELDDMSGTTASGRR